jgi:hypothetical protein
MAILDKLRRNAEERPRADAPRAPADFADLQSHRITDTPGTPADFADLPTKAEKISEISNDPKRVSDSEQSARPELPPLSDVTRARLTRVVRELVAVAVAFYADDAEDLAAMSHDDLKHTVVAYIGRQLYVKGALNEH